jgi:hypothetical protein
MFRVKTKTQKHLLQALSSCLISKTRPGLISTTVASGTPSGTDLQSSSPFTCLIFDDPVRQELNNDKASDHLKPEDNKLINAGTNLDR